MKTIVQQAIEQSIMQTEIVTIESLCGGAETSQVLDDLVVESEDYTSYPGPDEDCTYIHEFWGTDEGGSEWRVHVITARQV